MENNLHIDVEKKLYELLPDYVLGRLGGSDKDFFELHYNDYPNVVSEVAEGKKLFDRLEAMDFDKVLSEHTRNISVKVLKKMEKYDKKNYGYSAILKLVLPSVGIVAITLIMFMPYIFKEKEVQIDRANIAKIEQFQIDEITDDPEDASIDALKPTTEGFHHYDKLPADKEINEYLENEYDTIVDAAYDSSPALFWGNAANSSAALMHEINKLSEDEFQDILEAIETNEKII